MKGLLAFLLAVVLFLSVASSVWADDTVPAYKDIKLSFEKRAADLVSRMTLEEKISQTSADSPAIPRLGLPAYHWWNECLHGVLAHGFTVFPQAIGMASSWEPDLLFRVSTAISDEARASYNDMVKKGSGELSRLDFWSPNINIARDPRWGRNQETYGEDPYLTSRMGVNFVKGLQGSDPKYIKVVSTPKHYAVHSGPEPLRHKFDAKADPHDLWDTYLPAFQACVTEAGAYSVMGAYSRLNGVPCCENKMLLDEILRRKWGFKGYVVSDCGAIEDIWNDHKVENSPEAAAAAAIKAGCDLACGFSCYAKLPEAVEKGLITEREISRSVERLMEARMRLGMFDPAEMVPYSKITTDSIRSKEHLDLSLEAARKSIVLLKNDKGTLPLDKKIKSVAVIGPCADVIQLGNYTGRPATPVTILQGIKEKLGSGSNVVYAKGCELALNSLEPIPSSALSAPGTDTAQQGLKGEYFANEDFSGTPVITRIDPKVDFDWKEGNPGEGLPKDHFCARWTGKLTPPTTGRYAIGTYADDGVRLYLNGKKIIDNWAVTPATGRTTYLDLEAGKSYDIKLEYYESYGQAVAGLRWSVPGDVDPMIKEAVDMAKQSEVAVLVLGTPSGSELGNGDASIREDEGIDRSDITLSSQQQELLEKVYATGKPVVLLLTGGSTIAIPWATEHVPAIVETWFAGELGGRAVSDVLFGDYNPAGRLPMTCYKSLEQVPDFENYSMEGRTYRYFKGTPLYPFGFGLSYTSFAYSDLALSTKSIKPGEGVTVTAQVKNTGKVAGDEVVELYLTDVESSYPTPIRKLAGFQRINLKEGESKKVSLAITPSQMEFVDGKGNRVLEPGRFKITLGGSQGDQRSLSLGAARVLSGEFEVK